MGTKEAIKLFEEKRVRTAWDDEQEKWYFSIVDVVDVLTDSKDALTARKYWNKLKQRLKEEGNETVTNCHQLKLRAADGKMRLTDVADTEQLFRIIQSIPSPKAKDPQNLEENMQCAAKGGEVARVAREQLESKTGRDVVSPLSAKRFFEAQQPTKRLGEAAEE